MPLMKPWLDDALADGGLGAAAEQHAVGVDDRALAGALEAGQDVQQEGVVAVLGRRDAVLEAAEVVVGRVEAAGPVLVREREVGDHEVEGLQAAVGVLEVRGGQGVGLPDLRGRAVVQHHVHARQGGGGVVHLLAVEGQVQAGAALGLVVGLEQQGAGAAGRVVDGLVGAGGAAQVDHHGHDARHLGRGVELALALAGLGGEVAHQVLVGVAEQVVALGAVAAEVQALEDRHQLGEPVHHLLALAELVLVVEVGDVDRALQAVVGVGQPADDLVDAVADLLVALGRHHVGEARRRAAPRSGRRGRWRTCRRRT